MSAERDNVRCPLRGVSFLGVTTPADWNSTSEGQVQPEFLRDVETRRRTFGGLSSAEKCREYRAHGATIGAGVEIGSGTVILAPQIVLRDGAEIGVEGSIDCRERFVMGERSRFGAGLLVQGTSVDIGNSVLGGSRVEISGGASNPFSVLCIGDSSSIEDDAILDISRPIIIGKEVSLRRRSVVMTHNVGQSILEGFENRFEPVVLEDRCEVGINSTVYAGSRIGCAAILGPNSYLICSVPAGSHAIGIPARVIEHAATSRTSLLSTYQRDMNA